MLDSNFISLFLLFSHKKDLLKWVIDINVRTKTLKLLEENRSTFCALGLVKALLDTLPKAQGTKDKIR